MGSGKQGQGQNTKHNTGRMRQTKGETGPNNQPKISRESISEVVVPILATGAWTKQAAVMQRRGNPAQNVASP